MATISTRKLTKLPDVNSLRELMQSLAMLDAILCPDWDGRYYSFNCRWNKNGDQMGSVRDGCGNELFALFNSQGCFIKGFDHEAPILDSITPDQHYQGLPAIFESCVSEPAFSTDDVTFCIWRLKDDSQWSRNSIALPKGGDPDGSEALLTPFDGNPKTYQEWAGDYYECDVSPDAVRAIYERKPLTKDLVTTLNPDQSLKDLKDDIREIGYPR